MAGAETTVERLRKFLRELSPGARSLLFGELERQVDAAVRFCAKVFGRPVGEGRRGCRSHQP